MCLTYLHCWLRCWTLIEVILVEMLVAEMLEVLVPVVCVHSIGCQGKACWLHAVAVIWCGNMRSLLLGISVGCLARMCKVSHGHGAWCPVDSAVDPSASSIWMYVVLVVVC